MTLKPSNSRSSEAGNVFFALFGTVVLIGILGATVATFVKGPLTSSIQITRNSAAQTQMSVISQVIIMQAATAPNCDGDSFVEPVVWRLASGTEPRPATKIGVTLGDAGLLPTSLGVASTKDPWGTEYGYCVWDHGASSCGSAQRLAGTATSPENETVVALISAGPDKKFTTTCRNSATATTDNRPLVSKNNPTDDDIIFTYSYSQASASAGGLWTLNSANDATIDKDIQVDGSAAFTGAGRYAGAGGITTNSVSARTADAISILTGFTISDQTQITAACDDTYQGVLRRNASALEICVGTAWTKVVAGGSSSTGSTSLSGLETGTTSVCNGTSLGRIRFNTNLRVIEYCNGSSWRSLQSRSLTAALTVTPAAVNNVAIAGPCVVQSCPYMTGTATNFVVSNIASSPTSALDVTVSSINGAIVQIDNTQAASCQGRTLAAGASCIISAIPLAAGNGTFHATINVIDGVTQRLAIPMTITGSGFTCMPGVVGWGGIVVTCANSTTPDYIINLAGCSMDISEPICSGLPAEDPVFTNNTPEFGWPDFASRASGAQNTVNLLGYGYKPSVYTYCDTLVKNGYDNWFVPSVWEYSTLISPNDSLFQVNGDYWTSTYVSDFNISSIFTYDVNAATGVGHDSNQGGSDYRTHPVRCMRRHGQAVPTIESDFNPRLILDSYGGLGYTSIPLHLKTKYALVASQAVQSETFMVTSINAPTLIEITGPGSPTLRINGGAAISLGTVKARDMVTLYATGPATAGTQNEYTVRIGSVLFNWGVFYPTTNIRKIFATNTTYTGGMGGLTGADTRCQTAATSAGETGNWIALLSDDGVLPWDRISTNWYRLQNMKGDFVASNVEDFTDGSLETAVRYNESGGRLSGRRAWTGMHTITGNSYHETTNNNCLHWNNGSSSYNAYVGNSGSKTSFMFQSSSELSLCNASFSIYCMGPF